MFVSFLGYVYSCTTRNTPGTPSWMEPGAGLEGDADAPESSMSDFKGGGSNSYKLMGIHKRMQPSTRKNARRVHSLRGRMQHATTVCMDIITRFKPLLEGGKNVAYNAAQW